MKIATAVMPIAALFAVMQVVRAADHTEAAAESASRAWLALVDTHEYADSWKKASTFFRQSIAQSQWQAAAAKVREPLGTVVSRKLQSVTFTRTVPGAPEGEYAIVIFASTFATKASGIETVTSMVDSDGAWHVSGYYIR
jgi:hypothetical protein